jgi:hypothetical protein
MPSPEAVNPKSIPALASRRGFELEGSPEGHPQQRFSVQGTKPGDA